MSYITDIVVVTGSRFYEDALTAPMEFDEDRRQSLARLDTEAAGGVKVFTGHVYAAACNYLPTEQFKDWVTEVLSNDPSAVVWMDTEGEIEVFRPAREYAKP